MSAFSSDMIQVTADLCAELGNACVLTKVSDNGVYNPATGETVRSPNVDFHTHSVMINLFEQSFGRDGQNTNLSGFENETVVIPNFGQEVDSTWLYNGFDITDVSSYKSDNEVLYYTLSIGSKR